MAAGLTPKNMLIGISIIVLFSLLVLFLSMYFNAQHDAHLKGKLSSEQLASMNKEEIIQHLEVRQKEAQPFHNYYLIPFAAFIGLLVGLIVYYIMAGKISEKEKVITNNTKVILNFLSGEERKVIMSLLENNGKIAQFELSHLPGLGKVKTHRILLQLEQKGVIKKEKLGKVNRIVLDKELYDVLKV